jgi:hypothetical protein
MKRIKIDDVTQFQIVLMHGKYKPKMLLKLNVMIIMHGDYPSTVIEVDESSIKYVAASVHNLQAHRPKRQAPLRGEVRRSKP